MTYRPWALRHCVGPGAHQRSRTGSYQATTEYKKSNRSRCRICFGLSLERWQIMASLNKLVVNLTANTGKFNKGMSRAQSRLQRFSATAKKVMGVGLAAGAGVAAVGIAGMVRQMGALDKTAKLAARSGFSAKTIAGMGFAAEQSGSDVASMNKAFDKFSRSMGEATEGTGAASDALGMMGLNIEDLMGMKPDQRLLAVSDAIAGLKDPSLRASAAADLFGRSGVELVNVLGMGSEGIKKFQAEADRLGLGFDAAELAKVEAANDAINRVKRSIGGMLGSMAVALAPVIEAIADTLVDGLNMAAHAFKTLTAGAKAFFDIMPEAIKGKVGVGGADPFAWQEQQQAAEAGPDAGETSSGKKFAAALGRGSTQAYSAIMNATGNKQNQKLDAVVANGREANALLRQIADQTREGAATVVPALGIA